MCNECTLLDKQQEPPSRPLYQGRTDVRACGSTVACDNMQCMFPGEHVEMSLQHPEYYITFVLLVLGSRPTSLSWENSNTTPHFCLLTYLHTELSPS
jgi:hypothetical protein